MLILAIFAVVLLAVLSVGISTAVRVELRASRTTLERIQALFLAEAGLRQACALLLYDDQQLDTLQDTWGPESARPLDLPRAAGDGFYRVRVYDACGRIDVNHADLEALSRVTGNVSVASAIVAWREGLGGPDDAYYRSLPYPYEARGGFFQSLGELLLVRGVTPEVYFGARGNPGLADLLSLEGRSLNTNAQGEPRIELNSFSNWGTEAESFERYLRATLGAAFDAYIPSAIYQGWDALAKVGQRYTSLAQLYTVAGLGPDRIPQIIDYFTVVPSLDLWGLVNINTASPEVLALLPGCSPGVAGAIVARRRAVPFTSLGDFTEFLWNLPDGPELFVNMIDHVNVKSSSFIIESMGYLPGAGEVGSFRTLRALVRRETDQDRHTHVIVVQQSEQDWPLPSEQTEIALSSRGSREIIGRPTLGLAQPSS